MRTLTIDIQEITSDLLRPEDSPVLLEAVREAIDPIRPLPDGAGFDNQGD